MARTNNIESVYPAGGECFVPTEPEYQFNIWYTPKSAVKPGATKGIDPEKHKHTMALLEQASGLAQKILSKGQESSGSNRSIGHSNRTETIVTTPLIIDNSDRSINIGNSTNINSNNTNINSGNNRTSEKDNSGSYLAGVIFTIAAFVGVYFLGKNMALLMKHSKEIKTLQKDVTRWETNKEEYNESSNYTKLVDSVAAAANRILTRQWNNSVFAVASLTAFVGGCILGAAGGYFVMPPLIIAGVVVGSITVLIALGKAGYDCANNVDEEDAKEITKDLKEIGQIRADNAAENPEFVVAPKLKPQAAVGAGAAG